MSHSKLCASHSKPCYPHRAHTPSPEPVAPNGPTLSYASCPRIPVSVFSPYPGIPVSPYPHVQDPTQDTRISLRILALRIMIVVFPDCQTLVSRIPFRFESSVHRGQALQRKQRRHTPQRLTPPGLTSAGPIHRAQNYPHTAWSLIVPCALHSSLIVV